jgi:hypothetical protein
MQVMWVLGYRRRRRDDMHTAHVPRRLLFGGTSAELRTFKCLLIITWTVD